MEIYKSSSAEWPLLQSKTENKFKSGLFNVSAEFIRPVGDDSLPTQIETSIGPVDVWPEPTVSSGTDGFERINATGYGVWNPGIVEATWGITLGTIFFNAQIATNPDQPYLNPFNRIHPVECFFETVSVKKIGSAVPAIPIRDNYQSLRIFDINSNQIDEGIVYNVTNYFSEINQLQYDGVFQQTLQKRIVLKEIRQINFGSITETEAVYSIDAAGVPFGYFIYKT